MRPARRACGLMLALLCSLLAGCIQMPTSGPVTQAENTGDDTAPYIGYNPEPPRPGAEPAQIVSGFLEAMKATPMRMSVARRYLTEAAQQTWQPEAATITYGAMSLSQGQRLVRARMADANLIDSRGAWQRQLSGADLSLDIGLRLDNGEWRISSVPDALIVPQSWFDDRFTRASLYFFDPAGEVLVPEPVYVPMGDQMATALVSGLLSGPAPGLGEAERTFVPEGLSLALSVPIGADGKAELSLSGSAADARSLLSDEAVAQLSWTLRQVPQIRAVRLSVDGRPLSLQGGTGELRIDLGTIYDPTVLEARTELYALRAGLLVSGTSRALTPTNGSFGTTSFGLRSVSVNLTGSTVLGVKDTGTDLLRTSVIEDGGVPVQVVTDAENLLPPAWDYADRAWIVDAGRRGAAVYVLNGTELRAMDVPGISDQAVRRLLVSRDGSRLVALVRERTRDLVVVSRVLYDDQGRLTQVTPAVALGLEAGQPRRLLDIAWRSPTTVALLSDLTPDISQVRLASVDASPAELERLGAFRVNGPARQLIGSPVDGQPLLARVGRVLTDVSDVTEVIPELDPQVTSLTTVG